MVRGRYNYTPKSKPKLPPELRGGKIGRGWFEDQIVGEKEMVSCEKVLTSDRTAKEESYLEAAKKRGLVKEEDNVNHPPHYNNSPATCECGRRIECIDVTRHYPFNIGNAIKYLWRAELKGNALEDLKKAAWYIQDEIAKREKSR